MSSSEQTPPRPRGTGPFYLVALMCSGLSLDTAARYFHSEMHINGLIMHAVNNISAELAAICSVGELTLIACGYAMRHNVRRDGKPGIAQLVALAMCSAATFMAFALNGPVAGGLRAFFGPILALITLHLALGIEVKVHKSVNAGVFAKVFSEMRERVMSRLGLGDDERKAAERSRDRARDRAARLATTTTWTPRRMPRLVKAVRASGATLDPVQRDRLIEQVAVLRNVGDLTTIDFGSPWVAPVLQHPSTGATGTPGDAVPAPLELPSQHPSSILPAPRAGGVPAPLATPHVNGSGTPAAAPFSGSGTPVPAPPTNGSGTPVFRHGTPAAGTPAPRANGTGAGTPAPPVTSDGTPDGTPGDEEYLTVLRDPARVPREGDGTVPIKRAIKVLGVGRPRAIRLLDAAGLRRYPDPDDGSGTPDGTPAAEGSGTGADDDPHRVPAPRANGYNHELAMSGGKS